MDHSEARHRLISTLLQADGALPPTELASKAELPPGAAVDLLDGLLAEGMVVRLGEAYRWAARWEAQLERRTADTREALRAAVPPEQHSQEPDLEGEAARAFCDFIAENYTPPEDKRLLVFLQCSVRRPFSSSPSHASMKRAIRVATGFDPEADFLRCPVHVVVLASTVGPVPCELEDCFPANVRSGGVQHFDPTYYSRARPILAERMARYLSANATRYDRVTTFTRGRYAEVMHEAARLAGTGFPVLPVASGPSVLRMGSSTPRKYWEKYWIQLHLEVARWLTPAQQDRARARLAELDVEVS